jgi:hypothetical protein
MSEITEADRTFVNDLMRGLPGGDNYETAYHAVAKLRADTRRNALEDAKQKAHGAIADVALRHGSSGLPFLYDTAVKTAIEKIQNTGEVVILHRSNHILTAVRLPGVKPLLEEIEDQRIEKLDVMKVTGSDQRVIWPSQ